MKPEKNLNEVVKPVSAIMSFNTDELSMEELDGIISRLQAIRAHKAAQKQLEQQFDMLLAKARQEGLSVYGFADPVCNNLVKVVVDD